MDRYHGFLLRLIKHSFVSKQLLRYQDDCQFFQFLFKPQNFNLPKKHRDVPKMVVLHIKKGDQNQFLFETDKDIIVEDLVQNVCAIFNGRLKVSSLANHCSSVEKRHCIFRWIVFAARWKNWLNMVPCFLQKC